MRIAAKSLAVETAVQAHDLYGPRGNGPLRCVIHVSDPDLQGILKQHAIYVRQDDPFELKHFLREKMVELVRLARDIARCIRLSPIHRP